MGWFTRKFFPGKQLYQDVLAKVEEETKAGNIPEVPSAERTAKAMNIAVQMYEERKPSPLLYITGNSLFLMTLIGTFRTVLANSPPLNIPMFGEAGETMESARKGIVESSSTGGAMLFGAFQGLFSGLTTFTYRSNFLKSGFVNAIQHFTEEWQKVLAHKEPTPDAPPSPKVELVIRDAAADAEQLASDLRRVLIDAPVVVITGEKAEDLSRLPPPPKELGGSSAQVRQ